MKLFQKSKRLAILLTSTLSLTTLPPRAQTETSTNRAKSTVSPNSTVYSSSSNKLYDEWANIDFDLNRHIFDSGPKTTFISPYSNFSLTISASNPKYFNDLFSFIDIKHKRVQYFAHKSQRTNSTLQILQQFTKQQL